MEFAPGQRWYSLTEPELGLGRVEAVEGRQVVIAFPARDMVRRYAGEDPPLVRALLNAGQKARGLDVEFAVEEVVADGALLVYRGGGEELAERELDAASASRGGGEVGGAAWSSRASTPRGVSGDPPATTQQPAPRTQVPPR